jgi:hypothetical protein
MSRLAHILAVALLAFAVAVGVPLFTLVAFPPSHYPALTSACHASRADGSEFAIKRGRALTGSNEYFRFVETGRRLGIERP